jgi:hypothetical protein
MASGLIYLAIIGMWVAYFAPRWIHDRNEFSGKSVEQFKYALRVVAAQSPTGANSLGAIHIDLDRDAKVRQLLLRRRIIFTIIIFSIVTTIVGGFMNTMPFLYALVPISAMLVYIANVRRHVIADQLHMRRVTQLHRRSAGFSATNLSEVLQPKANTEHWIPMSEPELKRVVIVPRGSATYQNVWEPTEVPLPTYVNAPKAVTSKRVIDLTNPGQWTEEQKLLERQALAAASPSRDEIFDLQLAEEAVERLDQSRAANE